MPVTMNLDEKVLWRKKVKKCVCGYLVQIHSTKTLQDKSRRIGHPILPNEGHILCPVTALDKMFQVISTADDAPAFCTLHGNPIGYWVFNNFIKDVIDRTGLVGNKYSTHHFAGVHALLLQPADCRTESSRRWETGNPAASMNIYILIYRINWMWHLE